MSQLHPLALLLVIALVGPGPGRGEGVFAVDGKAVDVVDVTRRTVVDLDDPDAVVTMPAPALPPTVAPTVEDEGRPRRPSPTPSPAPRPPRPTTPPGRDPAPWLPGVVMGLLLVGVVLLGARAAFDARRGPRRAQAPVN